MRWPTRPVEQIPPTQFRPPHCPHADCIQHRVQTGFRYKLDGRYPRMSPPRRVQRFRCKACGGSFSQQTFSWSYYLKKPQLGPQVAAALNAGSANRQIARSLGCAPSTVTRLSARLGRHALLLHFFLLQHLGTLSEPVVLDHFETFVSCQLDALGVGTVVGHHSWFVLALDPAPHRRGGRLTPAQKQLRERRRIPRPKPGSVRRSCRRLLDLLVEMLGPEDCLQLITDNHPAYGPAVTRHPASSRIQHHIYPNPARGPKGAPRSPQARERDEAMFPGDQYHALLRHTCAHHRRETIAFPRRINASLERGFLTAVWRNLVKWRSERRPDRSTPAMVLGLTDRVWSWNRVLAQRLFPSRVEVPKPWMRLYNREWDEDGAGRYTRHRLKHAM